MSEIDSTSLDLREIGHDMRNALHSVTAGMKMLAKANNDPRTLRIIELMSEGVGRLEVLIQALDGPPASPLKTARD